jgi:hypothetical protein
MCILCINPYLHFNAQRNSTYHAQTCPTTTHSCEQAMYRTHLSAWSVELWASVTAMYCAPFAPMAFTPRLCAHVCERRPIQRDLIHTTRVRGRIHHPSKHQIQPRVHAICLYSSAQCIRIYCTPTYALIRAGYVPHSLECLECRIVSKSCSNVLRSPRAYGVVLKAVRTCVCVRRSIQHTCVAHDARFHTYNRVRGHIHTCIRACRHTKYKHACMPCTYNYLHSSAQRNSVYHHTRAPLLRTHASRLCTTLT